ncbi:hypothetical protein BDY24DRAFT_402658 [Mrakia frigida]|uniref:uncharacterized protein n=1 Tax=Mrakia frigida TaxID=29902 RepID=UPI003FCC2583
MEDENELLLSDELETTNTHRLTLLTSLSSTLSALSSTAVPLSIHQALDSNSTTSSSLFGSHAGLSLSNKGDVEPVEEEESSGKNLRDFIDEEGMDALMDALDEEQAEIDNLLPTLLALPESLLAPLSPSHPLLPDPKLTVQDALRSQKEILEHMGSEMDALARHLDQVGEAVRAGEEGEEVDVLIEDTAHLPSVLDELSSCLLSLQHIRSSLSPSPSTPPRPSSSPTTTLLSTHTSLHSLIHTHLAVLTTHLTAVQNLDRSLHAYRDAFDALREEVKRRGVVEVERERRRAKWEEEEREREEKEDGRREGFLAKWGEKLPGDLWSTR